MPDTDATEVSPRARREAADWVEKRQRGFDLTADPVFRAWRADRPGNARAYEEAQTIWDEAKGLAGSRTAQARNLTRAPIWMRHKARVVAGGVVAVTIVVSIVGGALPSGPLIGLVTPAVAQAIETRRGEIKAVRLSDGSNLTLDTDSKVRVEIGSHARRLILDRGRLRLRANPDAARPFVVVADGRTITTDGALLDVTRTKHGARITAITGVVLVRENNDVLRADSLVSVREGETLNDIAAVAADAKAPDRPDLTWPSGMLSFAATPLGQCVAELNRYNALEIKLSDPGLAHLRITGGFRATDPTAFVRSIAAIYAVSIDASRGSLMIWPGPGQPAQEPPSK